MIKARWTSRNGKTVFFFGLSDGNLELLRSGRPIVVDMAEMGGPPDSEVAIAWGATEEHIVADMQAAGMKVPS